MLQTNTYSKALAVTRSLSAGVFVLERRNEQGEVEARIELSERELDEALDLVAQMRGRK